jgi:superfamily I DNA/RNA helicase
LRLIEGGDHRRALRNERSELYVAMTRAEDVLVILHSGHSAYIDELRANDGSNPAR